MFQRLTIELTNHCNLSCKMCPRHYLTMPMGYMEEELFYKLMDQLPPHTTVIPFWRGESLLHPKFVDLMYYAASRKMEVVLAINGHNLSRETFHPGLLNHLDTVSVSLHDNDSYMGYLWLLEQHRKLHNPKTNIALSRVEGDALDIPLEILNELPTRDYIRHTINGVWGQTELIKPTKPKTRKKCVRLKRDLVIAWNGEVSRCCYVWKTIPKLNVTTSTLTDVFNSIPMRKIRTHYPDDICDDCDQWAGEGKSL